MLGKYKRQWQEHTLGLGRFLARTGLTPNKMSGLAFAVAILTTIVLAQGQKLLLFGAILVLFSSVMDLFDGAIARATGQVTKFGGVLDHTLDRYVEYLVLLGLMLGGIVDWFWGVFAIVGMILPSSTKAKAQLLGVGETQLGIAERQERQTLLVIGIFVAALFPSVGLTIPYVTASGTMFYRMNLLTFIVALIGVLSHITVFQRLHAARKYELEQQAVETDEE